MTAPRIGFIGLGNMGGRMTACLVRAGVDVLELATDEDLPQAVVRQLHMRQAPRAAAAAHASGAAHG